MKKWLFLFLLLPSVTFAQLTVPQGGTGTTTIPQNYVLIGGPSTLRITAVATSSLGLESPLTFSTGLNRTGNAVTCITSNSTTFGCLSGTDWTTFNNKVSSTSLSGTSPITYSPVTGVIACPTCSTAVYTGTYPIIVTGSVISIAFGTTTSNVWAGTQTFTNSPIFSTLGAGTVNSLSNGTIYSSATSTPTVTAPITYSGTLGSFIGGVGGTFACTSASAGVTGCMTATDWGLLHTATTTFSSPLVYTGSTNAVTCPTCGTGTVNSGTTGQVPYYASNGTTLTATSTLFIANGSNVGIGLTNPGSVLELKATSTAATGQAFIAWDSSNKNLFQITNNGNIGISTSTPGSLLSLNNIANFTAATSTFYSTGGINIAAGCFAIANSCLSLGSLGLTGTQGQIAYFSGTNAAIGTSTIFITQNSEVGIGTTTGLSGTQLTVESGTKTFNTFLEGSTTGYMEIGINNRSADIMASGDFILGNNLNTTSGFVSYYGDLGINSSRYANPSFTAFTPNDLYLYNSDGNLDLFTASSTSSIYFGTGGTLLANRRMTITSAGNVGIGTTSPATTLSVSGNGYFTNAIGVGKVNTVANSIDVADVGSYKYNGINVIIASTTLNNYFFGSSGNLTATNAALFNTAVGGGALAALTTGSGNEAFGLQALTQNTTGNNNFGLGFQALLSNVSGTQNIGIGQLSGWSATPDNNSVKDTNMIFIGAQSTRTGVASTTVMTNAIAIGVSALVGCSNCMVLGNSSVSVGMGTTTPLSRLTVNGDIGTDGTNVTVTGCGTGATVTAGSTDTAGEITEGTLATGCTISFTATKTRAPFCTTSSEAGLAFSYTSSATALTVTNIGALSSSKVDWICVQNNR